VSAERDWGKPCETSIGLTEAGMLTTVCVKITVWALVVRLLMLTHLLSGLWILIIHAFVCGRLCFSETGVCSFRFQLGIFLFTSVFRPALGPTQPLIQWVTGALSLGVKRPGREADHSPPASAEVKNAWSYKIHSPNTPLWRGAQLKHGDKFTFYFFTFSGLCFRIGHQEGARNGNEWNTSVCGLC
jgi:hypothetical protein